MSFHLSRTHLPLEDHSSSHANHDSLGDHSPKETRPRLEILLDNDYVALKGTGIDVEPARLSGHVALYLSESTSFKEITLQFRGKARLPAPGHDAAISGHTVTYVLCTHDWSFLEGHKKHYHTLKAGRHFFPFQLQIGGSLPSSVYTSAFGGASVSYKLRAHATRGGFAHNLDVSQPVSIIRSFTAEALEYQQTLEIENTWPEKLMYSIMVPHKAWAGGDSLTAQVKFAPLIKGIKVLSVNSTVHETVKVYGRSGYPDYNKVVCSARHEIVNGTAVPVSRHHSPPGSHSAGTPLGTPGPRTPGGGYFSSAPSSPTAPNFTPGSLNSIAMISTSSSPSEASSVPVAGPSSIGPNTSQASQNEVWEDEEQHNDVVAFININIPVSATPSHGLDPVHISHRIRWSILIGNPDGHTSELRCSLPIHILDYRLLDEAKANSSATRRLLIGGPEVPPDPEDEIELPSYNSHVRDRVANMYLPETSTVRVSNSWVLNGTSPTLVTDTNSTPSPSGTTSPLEAYPLSHLPHTPGSGDSRSLDWVNSELLLSLSREPVPDLQVPGGASRSPVETLSRTSRPASRPASRPVSRPGSRVGSRASSPERHGNSRTTNEAYVHSGNASRAMHGLFNTSMKPFTSLTHPSWLQRSNVHAPTQHVPTQAENERAQHEHNRHSPQISLQRDPNQLHLAFTAVPNYDMASQGFLGGVPPLSSMRGLPSYEEAERSHSDGDLASSFRRAMAVNDNNRS